MSAGGAPAPWDLSCSDWEQRLAEGRSLVPELPLDRVRADQAVGVFRKLRIPDVPGTPTFAEAAGQWILDIVAVMFGAFDAASAMRMVRGLFLLVPKKNAKTTYGAGIMLTALVLNRRPMAEMLLTAPSHEIAGKAFSQAKGMVELDPEGYLQKRFHIRDHLSTIEDRKHRAKLKIKTFDASIVTGTVPAAALIDEVHLLGSETQAEAIIGQLKGGMVSVPEAFWGMITTQSFKTPAGVFAAELKVARAIRDGRAPGIDTLPVLYEFSERQQKARDFWEDPANWPRITPNLGRSVWISRLVKDLEEVKLKGEEALRIWASQHLNVEIGLALHSDAWAGAEHWEAAGDDTLTLEELLRRSEVVVMGGDGGGLDDLLGLAVLGREKESRRWLLWCRAWCFAGVLERRKSIAPQLQDLDRAGELRIVEHLGDDMADVTEIARRVVDSGKLPDKSAVGLDTAGLGGLLEAFTMAGVTEDQLAGISQGWRLSGAIGTTERALADGTLVHAGQALMAWCVGNAKVEPRGNAKLITKQAAGVGKIDPLMATFNAVSLMALNPKAAGSIYDDEGDYAEAFEESTAASDPSTVTWNPAVIADPKHPDFAEHKRRFEEWQELQDADA